VIPAGATGTAQAVAYWTPAAEGKYEIHAYVSTPLDQVEQNNMLGPVTITITGDEPPEPPVVVPHAAQHEEGGEDEISIDGLKGRGADLQEALPHASKHQVGGADALNVGSLQGVLAQDQPAQVHSNTRHNPAMATEAELDAHYQATAAHTAATNLANRETTGIFTGLLKETQLIVGSEIPAHDRQALTRDRRYSYPRQASIGVNAGIVTVTPVLSAVLISLPVPVAWLSDDMEIIGQLNLLCHALPAPAANIVMSMWLGADQLSTIQIPFDVTSDRNAVVRFCMLGLAPGKIVTSLDWIAGGNAPADQEIILDTAGTLFTYPPTEENLEVRAELLAGDPNSFLMQLSGFARAIHPIP
jgi:hypothetical protein